MVLGGSRWANIMIGHTRQSTRSVVEQFKNARPPAVLVSPSMSTGWDFPYDTARYQIIGKVAFPDTRDPVTNRRSREDKEYPMFLAMTELQQMAGRINRAEDDYGETFIIDDNVQWFVNRYRRFASRWFLDAFKRRKVVPEPRGIDSRSQG
jgi:Rad3-related DNA helicase